MIKIAEKKKLATPYSRSSSREDRLALRRILAVASAVHAISANAESE